VSHKNESADCGMTCVLPINNVVISCYSCFGVQGLDRASAWCSSPILPPLKFGKKKTQKSPRRCSIQTTFISSSRQALVQRCLLKHDVSPQLVRLNKSSSPHSLPQETMDKCPLYHRNIRPQRLSPSSRDCKITEHQNDREYLHQVAATDSISYVYSIYPIEMIKYALECP